MATIKSYTDIEQSKVLAEILPLDSADYFYKYCIGHYNSIYYRLETYPYNKGGNKNHDIPCWSLSALLGVLPKLGAEEPIIQKIYYASNPTERYICQYSLTNMTGEYDNPVDACYEMVTILKEKNLI